MRIEETVVSQPLRGITTFSYCICWRYGKITEQEYCVSKSKSLLANTITLANFDICTELMKIVKNEVYNEICHAFNKEPKDSIFYKINNWWKNES